jgi:hypothetical protein
MSGVRAWKWGVAVVILAGLGWQVFTHVPPDASMFTAPAPLPLGLAFALGTASYIAFATAWARLRARGESWLDVGGVWFASLLARYAPGGVWQGAVRASGDRLVGVGLRDSLVRYASEQALACFSAATIALVSVAVRPLPMPALAAGLAAVALLAAIAPPLLARLGAPASWSRPAVLWTLTAHVLMAAGFASFAASWLPADAVDFIGDARGFLIAGLAGLLAVFVPAGLGVREAVLAWLLAPRVGVAAAVAIAIGARVWLFACECLAWTAWAVIRRRQARP